MPKLWECNYCKGMFPARDLYPCKTVARDTQVHNFLLCKDCSVEFKETQDVNYVDEFEDMERVIERLR